MTAEAPATHAGTDAARFLEAGWLRFDHDQEVARWADAARARAERLLADPALQLRWLRHGGTWFVGVNLLDNDAAGAVGDVVPPLAGAPMAFVREALGFEGGLDRAQLSAVYPGYPQPDPDETEAAFRFRRDRDAAHVDGLLRRGDGRRYLGEHHAFLLGVPLGDGGPGAAPFVVYEGSHRLMRERLGAALGGLAPRDWAAADLTEAYVAARREAFATCPRVEIPAAPGESYVVHRHALHGIAPWRGGDRGERLVAYFRPERKTGPDGPAWYLSAP